MLRRGAHRSAPHTPILLRMAWRHAPMSVVPLLNRILGRRCSMDVLRARGKVTTCQLTVAGSMSRSCERRFLSSLMPTSSSASPPRPPQSLHHRYIRGGVVSCYQVQLYHHHEPALLGYELSSTVRDHCCFDSLLRVLWCGASSRRLCCGILGSAAFPWW